MSGYLTHSSWDKNCHWLKPLILYVICYMVITNSYKQVIMLFKTAVFWWYAVARAPYQSEIRSWSNYQISGAKASKNLDNLDENIGWLNLCSSLSRFEQTEIKNKIMFIIQDKENSCNHKFIKQWKNFHSHFKFLSRMRT